MKKNLWFVAVLVLVLVLAACSSARSTTSQVSLEQVAAADLRDAGFTFDRLEVSGIVLETQTGSAEEYFYFESLSTPTNDDYGIWVEGSQEVEGQCSEVMLNEFGVAGKICTNVRHFTGHAQVLFKAGEYLQRLRNLNLSTRSSG